MTGTLRSVGRLPGAWAQLDLVLPLPVEYVVEVRGQWCDADGVIVTGWEESGVYAAAEYRSAQTAAQWFREAGEVVRVRPRPVRSQP